MLNDRILIVEDEEKLARLLEDYLVQSGFQVHRLADGSLVVPWVRAQTPRLILLDLMLPERNGLDICKELRAFSSVPIIMVTARIEEIDRLLGLELGADDYICKPFSPREVVARVKSVLRRAEGHHLAAQGVQLDEARYRAILPGGEVELTAVEFKLLHYLSQSPGRIYTRTQLMDRIYPDHRIVGDRTIDSHIKKLRKKLADIAGNRELIHSVYGVGYKFEETDTTGAP